MCILKKLFKTNEKKDSYVKVTENGSLYVDVLDLFKQDEFKKTVDDLLKSNIIKKIDKNKKELQTN